ncbi:MAG: cobyrinate a,c-diamide synthase [Devosiaceae bacterium]|nr:cobyrinate a,c-diamide synthase [Devosiaceae bacterium]
MNRSYLIKGADGAKGTKGIVIAAPNSGSGKTIFTTGLVGALTASSLKVAVAKTGPDYIDTSFLGGAAKSPALNLDPWAMDEQRIKALVNAHCSDADILVIEGVMGLFDGAVDGTGSTGDLSEMLELPVLLVVDAARQSQSVAALISGFANWRDGVKIVGIILNNVASERHEKILKKAIEPLDIPLVGILRRDAQLQVPSRHLGLVLAHEIPRIDDFTRAAIKMVSDGVDLDLIRSLAAPLPRVPAQSASGIKPLGQHIAIARDAAFTFIYEHWLCDWRAMGAQLSFFSPLANQPPAPGADAVFLPGGYPELYGEQLGQAHAFFAALAAARNRGALIYGECGGYMVLGQTLRDKNGLTHKMSALLPHETYIDRPRRTLGYRRLQHCSPLPWSNQLMAHEFHYSSSSPHNLPPLFEATDALGQALEPMGAVDKNVMGSYAHVIDAQTGGRQ